MIETITQAGSYRPGARGQGLRAGQVILSGALGPMVPVQEGDIVGAELGALGSVGCRFIA